MFTNSCCLSRQSVPSNHSVTESRGKANDFISGEVCRKAWSAGGSGAGASGPKPPGGKNSPCLCCCDSCWTGDAFNWGQKRRVRFMLVRLSGLSETIGSSGPGVTMCATRVHTLCRLPLPRVPGRTSPVPPRILPS